MRRWHLLPLALMGLSSTGALGQTLGAMGVNTTGVIDGACRSMPLPLVYALTLIVPLGTFLGLTLVKRRLTREGWSLANALSEPTRLTIPVEMRWTESAGDQMAVGQGRGASGQVIRGADGTPMAMTLLEASSSRMIATLGALGMLMLYIGFGTFALYSFGLTCQLPGSMPAVSTFLLLGLSLFAPYVANKLSTAVQPNIRSASPGESNMGGEMASPVGWGNTADSPSLSLASASAGISPMQGILPVSNPQPATQPPSLRPVEGKESLVEVNLQRATRNTMLFTSFSSNEPEQVSLSAGLKAKGRDGAVVMIPADCISFEGPDGHVVAIPPGCTIVVGSNGRAIPVYPNSIAVADGTGKISLSPKTFGLGTVLPVFSDDPRSSTNPTPEPRATAPSFEHHQDTAVPEQHDGAAHPKASDPWGEAYGPALQLIRSFEGFVDHAYPDPASGGEPWTIGYGFTTLNGRPVQPGQVISRAEADGELQRQAQACANHLAATIPYWHEMDAHQHCALLDFAWNLGADFYGDENNFGSITRDLKNHDWSQVPQTFLLYCDPGTAVEAGLLRRRQAEANLWKSPVDAREASTPNRDTEPSPQPGSAASHSRFSNPLKVPYNDQLHMADGQGWRECFSASSAMLAMYWGKEPNENVYDKLRARYGDSTNSDAQLGALRSLGLTANFETDGTVAMLKQEIDAGRPVAVGWLCDGPVSAPSGGGHWIVIIGYDDTGFLVNDPYGNCDLVNGGYLSHDDGAGLHYSYQNWVPRWRVDGTGGWMLTCRS
jgi:GH24 family phage-related lysozyme (muramidase)